MEHTHTHQDWGKDIVQNGHVALREEAKHIPLTEIKSTHIQNLIKKMKNALDAQDDGVGLAASQVGEAVKLFVVSRKVFQYTKNIPAEDMVFINPEIVKVSRTREWMDEGCLSVRPLFGRVKRSTRATIRAYDEHGQCFEMGASGLLAQIFQHEVDHLHGILFIDKAEDIIEVPTPVKK